MNHSTSYQTEFALLFFLLVVSVLPSSVNLAEFITGKSLLEGWRFILVNIFDYLIIIKLIYTTLFILRDVEHNKLVKNKPTTSKRTTLIVALISFFLFVFSSKMSYLYFLDLPLLMTFTVSSDMFIRSLSGKKEEKLGVDKKKMDKGVAIQTQGGFFNIPQPTRGILGVAGAGGGKTASLVRPIIRDALENNYSILCYDYKFPDLSSYIYTHLEKRKETNKFKCINFDDLKRTHRINPLHPVYVESNEAVAELCDTIARNLMDDHSSFWFSSLVLYMQAVLIYLRNEKPEFCTLPHLVSICLDERVENIVKMCQQNIESRDFIGAMFVAIEEGAGGQKAGVIGTVATYLNKLNTRSIFFVLTGNEADLVLNYDKQTGNPKDNRILCIGNTSEIQGAIKPVIALIIQCSIRVNNVEQKNEHERKGRIHYVLLMDEFPTLQLLDIEQLPATGRSRKIITFLLAQDLSQIIRDYGKERCNAIVANCANFFLGNCGSIETNEVGMKMFGKRKMERESESLSRRSQDIDGYSVSQSSSEYLDYIVQPHELAAFPPGEFLAKLVSTKDTFYKGRVSYFEESIVDIPPFREIQHPKEITPKAVEDNYFNIKKECREFVDQFVSVEGDTETDLNLNREIKER